MTALALRDDQTTWDQQQLAVLHGSGIDKDVSAPELTTFLHECQRRHLDPFTRQIYLIGRYSRREGRKVYRSQTSIDGFRLIARRAADEAKESIEYEETLWYDADGRVHQLWLSQGAPAGAKVVVLRNGKRFPVVARYSTYVQTDNDGSQTGLWKKMPDTMIAKCAEALALRMAFPEELGGIYTDEEMGQADNPQQNGHHTVTATAVKDGVPPDDIWQAPAPESTDQEWLQAALGQAVTVTTKETGEKLWVEGAERQQDGRITPADAKRVADLLRARFAELKAGAAEVVDAEAVEAFIVVEDDPADGLDPEDSWAAKVEDITCLEDAAAALADLHVTLKNGTIDDDRFQHIVAAIDVKTAAIVAAVAA